MNSGQFIVLSALLVIGASQRSPYAGFRPIGFPVVETPIAQNDGLGNRFGNTTTTTQRLPIEALGDRELVNRLGKLPQDKQPFWFINWQALEENRKKPQSYPQRPNVFIDSISQPIENTQTNQVPQWVASQNQMTQNLF